MSKKKSKWKKSSPELVERFLKTTAKFPKLEDRKMFGYPCCFLNGNMLMGLHEENWILRLSDEDREKLFDNGGKQFEPMKGRVMRQYSTIPEDIQTNARKLNGWVKKSIGFVEQLPTKR